VAEAAEREMVKVAFSEPESPSVTLASFTETDGAAAALEAAATTRKSATTPNAICALTGHFVGPVRGPANRPLWYR
jgi:hypothetical protein